jgi:hypothetical protein
MYTSASSEATRHSDAEQFQQNGPFLKSKTVPVEFPENGSFCTIKNRSSRISQKKKVFPYNQKHLFHKIVFSLQSKTDPVQFPQNGSLFKIKNRSSRMSTKMSLCLQ